MFGFSNIKNKNEKSEQKEDDFMGFNPFKRGINQ